MKIYCASVRDLLWSWISVQTECDNEISEVFFHHEGMRKNNNPL